MGPYNPIFGFEVVQRSAAAITPGTPQLGAVAFVAAFDSPPQMMRFFLATRELNRAHKKNIVEILARSSPGFLRE